jgi:electron transport complex protein RnfG
VKRLTFEKETIGYQGFFLALVTALATALLLAVYQFSEPVIAQKNLEDQLLGLEQVLPVELVNEQLLDGKFLVQYADDSFLVFPAVDSNGALKGYAVQSYADGFSGAITILMGTDDDLNITGVRVLSHAETPGLGDKIEIEKSNWITKFNGESLNSLTTDQWAVKKDGGDFDQFTGATITPRAVVKQIHETLIMLNETDVRSISND